MDIFMKVTAGMLALAFVWDLAARTIPNILTLGGALFGIVWHFHVAASSRGLWFGLGAAGLALVSGLLCAAMPFHQFRKGKIGGGDVKLFFAIGVLGGPVIGLTTYAGTYVLLSLRFMMRMLSLIVLGRKKQIQIPLAPFIAGAYTLVVVSSIARDAGQV